ncbi:FlgD immunoglobulin-like domain containing protein [Angustibacter sp. Root456]|uniref:FlgD immunoglobulin-like domain containing protein n=1 Tax=Angustibacter sp. Root456 TaxID=1736539 RepID=UPI0012FA59AA|nr:FlgD immunoglobulin-like domain containing protein [Angustibacter sp. Root456]
MRRRALFVGLVTSSLLGGAIGAGTAAGAAPLAAPAAAISATAWPGVDSAVADPADTVAVPRSPEVSPIPRRVLASSGGTRLILQPDSDGAWWLWWQQGTDEPVRSAQQVRNPRAVEASASSAHVVVHDSAYLTIDLAARTITPLTLEPGWTFVAATPDGYVDVNRTTKVLRRHLAGGSTSTLATDAFFTTWPGNRPAAADATGVVLSDGGVRWYPFDGGPSVVLATGQFVPDTFAVSPSSVAWTTRAFAGNATQPAQPPSVRRVLKTGGPVATHPVDELITDLAITDDATAWSGRLLNSSGTAAAGTRFAGVGNADLTQVTALPEMNSASAVAEADHLLLTDDAPASEAGLYAVTADGTTTLQTRTTPPLRSVRAFAFDGEHVVEEQLENGLPAAVGAHRVTADGVGPLQALDRPAGNAPTTLALAAGRLARQAGATTFSDLDTTVGAWSYCCGAAAPAVQQVEASGTTAVVAGTVVDMTTGRARFTLPGARTWAIFGDALAWSTDTGEVWRRTLATPPSKVVAAACTGGCAAQVGLWGDRLLVQPKVGDLQVRTTSGALLRTLPALPAAEGPWAPALTLEDGVLAWVQPVSGTAGVLRVVDVDAADPTVVDVAQAVRLPGLRAVELRDGRLMWLAGDRGLRLARLPLTRMPRVVLTALSAPSAFSPNHDGVHDTWVLDGIASAPLAGAVTLAVTRAGSPVRTVTATSHSGRFSLAWNGLTTSGSAAPEGVYTWQLRATSASGRPLTGLGRAVTGQLALRRSTASTVVSAPEVVSNVSTTSLFPVRWRTTTTQPSWSTITNQLQVAGRESGSRQWSGWQQFDVKTATGRTFDPRTTIWPTARQWRFRARAVAAGGAPGPWSPYVSANIPVDDNARGALKYSGAWSLQRVRGTFMGTQHRANRYGASVTVWPNMQSRLVRVLMTTCPTCGKVRIQVDGGSWLTVDTYSRTVRRRKLVYRSTKPTSDHRVTVRSVASGSRPYVYLDGVVFEP